MKDIWKVTANLLKIYFHNFIIVMLQFFNVCGARYKLATKSLSKLNYFSCVNLSKIYLHNFIIVKFYLFKVYRVRYKANIKSLGKFNSCLSF